VSRHLIETQAALAAGRIVHADPVARHLAQHHKMIEIPMQNGRQAQLGKLIELQSHRAGAQLFRFGDARECGECDALQRDGVAAAQGSQIGQHAMPAEHHRQTGQAAFGTLRLINHWKSASDAKREGLHQVHRCHRPVML
jgi:hypothetical protein